MNPKAKFANKEQLKSSISSARGEIKADIVLKNGQFLDVFNGTFATGDVAIKGNTIVGIGDNYEGEKEIDLKGQYIVPGFIDSHVHIESSLMTPIRFQETVLPCGTTTAIWDPHEITNVKGTDGIHWAIDSSEKLLMDVFVMVPSCVPSTSPHFQLETSGADLRSQELIPFRNHKKVLGLAEMMNFPGVLFCDDDVIDKLMNFSEQKRDGHCPGLRGKDLNAYLTAGIHSCHESISLEEAQEKIQKGMHVLIREGSCAKNAETLLPLLNSYTSAVLSLCSDDRNPLDIEKQGHINYIINMALSKGHAPQDIFRAASFAPALAYGLEDRGAVAPGYLADLCVIELNQSNNWQAGIKVNTVFKNGTLVELDKLTNESEKLTATIPFKGKNMNIHTVSEKDFRLEYSQVKNSSTNKVQARVIEVIPNQIITNALETSLPLENNEVSCDISNDILKIAVFERHHRSGNKTVGFVKGFGLKKGAIATSINHDSHNIIVVGASEAAMAKAVNHLIQIDGGIVVTDGKDKTRELPLPIGGLMTNSSPQFVSETLQALKNLANEMGCSLHEPFLQLAFLALPVIPSLKITDLGLVDVTQFKKVSVLLNN